jgi:hypothetical protein
MHEVILGMNYTSFVGISSLYFHEADDLALV